MLKEEVSRGGTARGAAQLNATVPGECAIAVTVILPAYNEAAALPTVLESLTAVLGTDSEIIVVDDASTDNTASIAASYRCRVLLHPQNRGKGAAVKTGLAAARGQFIVIMDADNTYPAAAIPRMVELAAGCDFVRCVRTSGTANMPVINRIGNKLFDWVLRILHGLDGADHLSGLYGLRREVLEDLQFTAERFDLEVEICIKARARRLRAAILPIDYGQRIGEKKLRAYRDGWAILHRVLSLGLLYNPGLCFVLPGCLMWGVAALLAMALVVHPIQFGGVTLRENGLMFAMVCSAVGFQLVIFGVAGALYGVEKGTTPSRWLLTLGRRPVRLAAIVTGTLASATGFVGMLALVCGWILSGARGFDSTGALVVAGALLTWGVQVLLAALFLSIFAGRFLLEERSTVIRQDLGSAASPAVLELEQEPLHAPAETLQAQG